MSHPTDWDVDAYRSSHESEEHWQLRKQFMERWKHNFPEDSIVCLARVFANIEFLGCRYPAEVMKTVAELSKEVAREYRESRKNKIRRTFVSASDAAGDKAKGIKRTANEHGASDPPTKKMFVSESRIASSNSKIVIDKSNYLNRFQKSSTSQNNSTDDNRGDNSFGRPSFVQNRNSSNRKYDQRSAFSRNEPDNRNRFRNQPNQRFQRNSDRNTNRQQDHNDIIKSQYGLLVLYERNGSYFNKLFSSCQTCKVPFDTEYEKDDTQWTCTVKINNIVVSSASGFSQKEAKESASQSSWEALKKKVFTLVIKQKHSSKEDVVISVQDVNTKNPTPGKTLIGGLDTKVDSAIATRMMQMMGWKGGALGSSGSGISEPIQPNLKQIRRTGLGGEGGNQESNIREAVKGVIREFAYDGNADYDLVFASDFAKDERAIMHKLALTMNLKSKSYGKDEDRYIVISKPISVGQLVRNLLDNGGTNQKYDLVHPTEK